jgi:3-oxoacyl-[acyl-carrier-protein] synthase-1
MDCIISGVGCISSLGRDEDSIVENLKKETVAIDGYESKDIRTKSTSISRCLDSYDLSTDAIPRSFQMDPLNLSYAVVMDALADAGMDLKALDSQRVALSSGTCASEMKAMRNLLGEDFPRVRPTDIMKSLPTAVTGPLSTVLKLKGSAHTVQHACATGLRAVAQGMDLISLGKADVVICVSVEKINDEVIRGFDAMRALYRGNDLTYASVPFTKDRAGFTPGEGGGCVILESEEHFKRRKGAKSYGKPIAYADYSDGSEMTNPSGEGASRSMAEVVLKMTELGYTPDFVSAHATSTPNGDVVEANVISNLLGDDVPVVAFKRLIGHTTNASGIIELIYSLYQMKHEFIVSNGELPLDPAVKSLYLPTDQIHQPIDSFVKNSFGFGGLNCVLGVIKHVQR